MACRCRAPCRVPTQVYRPAVVSNPAILLRRQCVSAKKVGGPKVCKGIEKHGHRVIAIQIAVALRRCGGEARNIRIEGLESHIQRRSSLADADNGSER